MPFAETLAPYFADFGQPVTVGGVSVQAIFDSGYALGNVASGLAATQPMLTLPTASVPANPVGAACVVGSVSYVVVDHQPDGTGVSALMLERA